VIGFRGPVATGALVASRTVKSNVKVVPNSLDTTSQSNIYMPNGRRVEDVVEENSINGAMGPVTRAKYRSLGI